MIYIDTNLTHCTLGNGKIAAIYPQVRIGLDVGDNVDMQKLKDFNERLQSFIDKGLNECLIDNNPQKRKEL